MFLTIFITLLGNYLMFYISTLYKIIINRYNRCKVGEVPQFYGYNV